MGIPNHDLGRTHNPSVAGSSPARPTCANARSRTIRDRAVGQQWANGIENCGTRRAHCAHGCPRVSSLHTPAPCRSEPLVVRQPATAAGVPVRLLVEVEGKLLAGLVGLVAAARAARLPV